MATPSGSVMEEASSSSNGLDSQMSMETDSDCLLDAFLALYEECTHDNLSKIKSVSNFTDKYRDAVSELKNNRMKNSDFEVKDVIGRGHFGEVRVVKHKSSGDIYAMKVIRKSDILAQPNISFFEEERNIMSSSLCSPWITKLHYAFQDSVNLYLVMDFYPGGDLLSLLSRHDNILDEEMAKFYLAEVAFAINSLHSMGYIHRDVKPENILLDHSGHIKLADFGSAAKMNLNQKVSASMPVGTPDYVAPELLTSISKSTQTTYGPEVDWWSLGVCAYEILFGALPFTSKQMSTVGTYASIMDFKKTLRFPADSDVSSNAKDFVKSLLTDSDSRILWEDVKSHPFFSGISWDNLQHATAKYIPSINGLDDTSNFDEFEKVQPRPDLDSLKPKRDFTGRDLPFIGFTYSKQSMQSSKSITATSATDKQLKKISPGFDYVAEKDEEIARLKKLLEKERTFWQNSEDKSVSLLEDVMSMNKEIRDMEFNLQEAKLEEVKANVVLMEADYEKLTTKLLQKERKLEKVETALAETDKKLEAQQFKLNKEKRKSREDQRKDLMLMDIRDETWQSLLDEKNAMIDELKQKVEECENLLEAYEESEEKQASEVTQLQHKMNSSLWDVKSTIAAGDKDTHDLVDETPKLQVDTLQHTWCPSKRKLVVQVTLEAGRCSFVDNKTVDKLQELQTMVDKYVSLAKTWQEKEEDLKSKLSALENENKTLIHKEGMGKKIKENLMEKVSTYQEEVHSQRAIIKELQASMSSYLVKSSEQSETESRLKVEKLQNLLNDQTTEVERLTGRNADIQKNLQALQQRNADLQVEVEKLQKSCNQNDEQKTSKIALNFQINHLNQAKDDLEYQLKVAVKAKQAAEDKVFNADKEKERLNRRIERLEKIEKEKRELELKLERIFVLERENRRLQTTADRVKDLEKEKLNLEEKTEKIQMEIKKEKVNTNVAVEEKKELETKLEQMKKKRKEEDGEEISKLKVTVTLLESVEKEKAAFEKEIQELNATLAKLEDQKENVEKLKMDNEKLIQEKDVNDKSVTELKREISVRDEQVNNLNRLVTRLETSHGALELRKSSNDLETKSLSFEVNRLKQLVDMLEKNKQEQDKEKTRNSVEERRHFFDKMQKEKSEVQRCSDSKSDTDERRRLQQQLREKEGELLALKKDSDEAKKEMEELQSRLEEQNANVSDLREQMEEQCKIENDLVAQLEKQASATKVTVEEKDKLAEKLKNVSTGSNSVRKSGENKFEKIRLEKKIGELTEERDELKKQVNNIATEEKNSASESDGSLKKLQEEYDQYKNDMEIRLGASKFSNGDIPAYLRHELNESNLALSEARSLLSAAKRQELELKERNDKLQRSLDNKAVENATFLQNSKDAMAELKSLMSQHDTLRRQNKILEEKHSNLQKQQGSNSSETIRLLEEINLKEKQTVMERKKTEALSQVCGELEQQIKDLEHLVAEADKRQAEWEKIKQTYEAAVNERDDDLDGATERIEAINQARSHTSEKAAALKQQLDAAKALHKAEIESINHKLREEKALVEKLTVKMDELMEKESVSTEILESQSKEMDKMNQEKLNIKQELTEALSDSCNYRKENLKLRKHLDEAMKQFESILGEKVSLENFTEAVQALHYLDKYKFQHTIGQQMKLIDHLQDLYQNDNKKKKGSKLFGSKSKANVKDNGGVAMSDCPKCHILQENLERLQAENVQQANELLKHTKTYPETTAAPAPSSSNHNVKANLVVNVTPSAMKALSGGGGYAGESSRASKRTEATSSTNSLASVGSTHSSSSSSSLSSSSSSNKLPFHSARMPSSAKKTGSSKASYYSSSKPPQTPRGNSQRMHHNIPHRFSTGLNSRATKCGLCLGSVHFVRQASKCQVPAPYIAINTNISRASNEKCKMVVHPKCASSVPPNCGLPTEYIRCFAMMTSRLNQDEEGGECQMDQLAAKMEGWLKVPRLGKPGWENRYCILEGTWLSFYLDENDGNPVDSFDLDPADADVTVHSAVTKAEQTTTASSDLHYILRLDQDPLTSCWPGRYVYMMTTSFQDKQRWVASLEAVVKAAQSKHNLFQHKSETLTVLSLKDSETRDLNCSLALSSQLVLVGTDDGLYAFNPEAMTCKSSQLTQLSGFGSVHQMILAKGVDLILILTGPERRLIMLENKLVKSRMSQTLGGETTPFSFRTIEGLRECTVFDMGMWNKSSYLCVGTPKKVYMMKYNPGLSTYCVRKEFPCSEPCSCVCIAENYAIVGTDRFYKINMEHPSLIDFVDRQDNSLAFAAFGAANHKSFPLAVVQVSPADLPLEFLLCFHEFGVFVDQRGQRSRAQDVKWSGFPLAFAYVDPFLYVTYFNSVQATVIPTDRSTSKGRQTVMDFSSPRYLGPTASPGTIYISSSKVSSHIVEVVQVRGKEDFASDMGAEKENLGSAHGLSPAHITYSGQMKTPKKGRLQQLRRQGSLTSMDSNYSCSTYASVESDV